MRGLANRENERQTETKMLKVLVLVIIAAAQGALALKQMSSPNENSCCAGDDIFDQGLCVTRGKQYESLNLDCPAGAYMLNDAEDEDDAWFVDASGTLYTHKGNLKLAPEQ